MLDDYKKIFKERYHEFLVDISNTFGEEKENRKGYEEPFIIDEFDLSILNEDVKSENILSKIDRYYPKGQQNDIQ